ncbi:MAG: S-methyl-5'-thioinosine phosphorylase [Proteobacteria bacterium]|nr:S-methyl-5'-thioinosine phosphorylase [Pseudomonadota bacterium]
MLAVIGGTGLSEMRGFEPMGQKRVATPYSEQRVRVDLFQSRHGQFAFLPRHGKQHVIPPHRINYRANAWALHKLGVKQVVAINAVGGIHENLGPGAFAIPDQLIDYTYGRDATFFEDKLKSVTHITFTDPFSESLRQTLLNAVNAANLAMHGRRLVMDGGVYACMQGPRLETAAEIRKLRNDGCDLVGMTAMPEAALLRELEIDYAMLALSVNWAAGLYHEEISMEAIAGVIEGGMEFVMAVLQKLQDSSGV